ncbi:MAG: glycosyltransferase [Verrucomicrobiota bacterium]
MDPSSEISLARNLPEVWLAGFLNSGLGLGETGRLVSSSLKQVGVPVVTHAWAKTDIGTVPFTTGCISESPSSGPSATAGLSLLSLNGDHLASFINSGGKVFFEGRYVISIWFWELEELPPEMVEGFKLVDEVWAATPFIQNALLRHSGTVPVRRFNHPIQIPKGTEEAAHERFPFEGRFVFLFTFDYQSCAKRKNPQGVCEAFVHAFPEPVLSGPLCVIKSINAALHPIDRALLQYRWSHRPDIIFMDEFLSAEDRDLLTWRADACVSLHRAEGLGLTLMEGMALGKPCIATGYSGNLAFMFSENSWLIPFTMIPVGQGSLHYPADQFWAEPDVKAAASAMREIQTLSPEVKAKARAGQVYVNEHHNPLACGREMATLISEAAGKAPRPRKPLSSGRSAAYSALADLREKSKQKMDINVMPWNFPSAIKSLRKEAAQVSRAERKAISETLIALKHSEKHCRTNAAVLRRRLERLTEQVDELISILIPPNTVPLPSGRSQDKPPD